MKRLRKNRKARINSLAIFALTLIAVVFTAGLIGAESFDGVSIAAMAGASSSISFAFVPPAFLIEKQVEKDGATKTIKEFRPLTDEQLTEFVEKGKAEDLAAYYNAKNDASRQELQRLIEAKASADDIRKLEDTIRQEMADQLKSLNDTLKQYGLAIKKMSRKESEARKKDFSVSLREALESKAEILKDMKDAADDESKAPNQRIRMKVVGNMTIAGNVSGGNVPVEQRLAGLDVLASRRIRLLDIVSRGVAQSNVISWVSQANKEGAAGGTTEGTAKNQIDFDLVVDSEQVKKRTAFIKASTEMLDDIDFIESEINNELLRELLKDVEAQVYEGDDTGNNLNGIRTVAPAFAAGTFAGTVDNANAVDVLTVAMNQIAIAEQDESTAILMHPSDVTALKMVKVSGTDKRYVDRLVTVAGNLSLDGVPIIPTTLVTADEYLIGNFEMATVWDKGEVNIEIGLDGNDFTENMRTIIAEWRGLVIVKTNRRSAFVAGTFSTDQAALETP